nr:MAG TPA: hypothetical protein [Caudoviricetes sp.]
MAKQGINGKRRKRSMFYWQNKELIVGLIGKTRIT